MASQTMTVRLPEPMRAEVLRRAEAAGVREALEAGDLDRRIEAAMRRVMDEI